LEVLCQYKSMIHVMYNKNLCCIFVDYHKPAFGGLLSMRNELMEYDIGLSIYISPFSHVTEFFSNHSRNKCSIIGWLNMETIIRVAQIVYTLRFIMYR
jgi:hypothetical protein